MGAVARIDVAAKNEFGRPTRFVVTDAGGAKYSWKAEELRWAVNTDAGGTGTLLSGFVTPVDAGTSVNFTNGHGWGHGVGMCQWCAEARARQGRAHEDIVVLAYPKAKLVRAY